MHPAFDFSVFAIVMRAMVTCFFGFGFSPMIPSYRATMAKDDAKDAIPSYRATMAKDDAKDDAKDAGSNSSNLSPLINDTGLKFMLR
jgi:hypothetical protein